MALKTDTVELGMPVALQHRVAAGGLGEGHLCRRSPGRPPGCRLNMGRPRPVPEENLQLCLRSARVRTVHCSSSVAPGSSSRPRMELSSEGRAGSEAEGFAFLERTHYCHSPGCRRKLLRQFPYLLHGDALDLPERLLDVLVFAGHQFGPAQPRHP
ncbi:hypothetical protein D9M72_472330 [compost metagenome]